MTPKEVTALGPALAAYLDRFEDCFVQDRTREHLHTYCRGLLSDLPRKSVEPIALTAGTAVRTLQEFLRDHVWDHDQLRDLLQQRVAQHAVPDGDDLGCVGLIDETGKTKKGTKTPGVHRQWCGEVGKLENGIVTVHLGLVQGGFKTLLDADLFLPKVWDADRDRCGEAGILDSIGYRPKWRIALEQLDHAQANGVHFDWLTFEENYGSKPAFLENLDGRPGLYYVGEVPKSFHCLAVRPRGKKPPRGWKGKRADNLFRYSSALNQRPWQGFTQARLTRASQEWEVRAGQVYLVRRGQLSARTYWLIQARNLATGEIKYFVSNAPTETPLERLLRVAFRRWNVEHGFRVSKTELGFGHFEGRSYTALMRHLILCLLMLNFVAEHTERLRGEKSGDHPGTGLSGAEPAVRGVAGQPPGDIGLGTHGRGHCLPPAA